MIKLLLLFLIPLSLFSSKILSYNIYDRTDRVDVMITFDTPYDGAIRQSKSNKKIIIKLEDAMIESSKLKQLSSRYISSLSITPMANYTQIVASIPESVMLKASKTSDGYGLRLRFSDNIPSKTTNETTSKQNNNPLSSLPMKKTTEISSSYYMVIFILIVAIIVLFVLKKRLPLADKGGIKNSSWLFKETNKEKSITSNHEQDNLNNDMDNVSIRFQKSLNEENSVVMLDFGEQSYLVLMGKSNILLDKFTDNKPSTQSDFETILQSRHQQLDNFLNGEEDSTNDSLESYKNKASYISYEA